MKNIHAYGALFALSLVMQSIPGQADLNNSIYVPVEPCRVGNSLPTKVTDGTSVEWLAYGDDMSTQGGAGSPGCPQPKTGMKPIGVALNVTVVGNQATGNGNVVAYPADGATPSGSLVNYKPGTNIANSTIVGLCQDGACDGKFKLQSNLSDVPVIADVQGYFYPAPGNVANVALSGGDYISPVDAMTDVANWCDAPSTTNRCLVKIAPGTYDLGSNQIVMQEWVSIQGSGQKATKIIGAVSTGAPDSTSAVVVGVSNASLTDLSIENTGGSGGIAIAIYNNNASPLIERVTARASSGPQFNFAVVNIFSSSPTMKYVIAEALGSGGSGSRGVYNASFSSPVMMHVTVSASNGFICYGVYNNTSSSPEMTNVTIHASGGSSSNIGMYNSESSSPTLTKVVVKGSGGSSSYGVQTRLSSFPFIQNSVLEGGTYGLFLNTFSSGVKVVNSKIIGGVLDSLFPDTTQCRGNYDANLADVNC